MDQKLEIKGSVKTESFLKNRTTTASGRLDDIERYIVKELETAKMGINTFNEAARETKKTVTISHVNNALVQPHWRSHEQLIKQQVA